ncbi:MAG: hypothetical protein ACRDKV_06830 [Solirubrobacterales bacterium]
MRGRGRAFGIVTALAVSAAMVASPAAFGAGDPIASGKVSFKVPNGFKKKLKRNRVRMKPKNFRIRPSASNLDPVAGGGRIKLKGKMKFRGHGKKLVIRRLEIKYGDDGGNIKGRTGGRRFKLFRIRSNPGGAETTRVGFGARVTDIHARMTWRLAKRINRKLNLNSLFGGQRVAKLTISEQPETVQVNSGFVFVDIPVGFLPPSAIVGSGTDPNTVAAKQPSHCLDPSAAVAAIPGDPSNPARFTSLTAPDPVLGPPPSGMAARLRFPVTGGTVSPAGNDGVIQVVGGVRLMTGETGLGAIIFPQPAICSDTDPSPTASTSILDTENLAPNLGLLNVQANTTIRGTSPGCNGTGAACGPALFPGNKGVAIGQVIDASGIAVSADPNAHTVNISGALIRNNQTATTVLSGLFPNASGNPAQDFANNDKFGISTLSVNVR